MSQKILYLNPIAAIGGAERCLLDLLAGIDRTRFEPVVAAPQNGLLARRVREMGVQFLPLDFPRSVEKLSLRGRRSSAWTALAAAPEILRMVVRVQRYTRDIGPALIHANGIKPHLIGTLAGVPRRVPVVWHLHDFLQNRTFERMLGRLAYSASAGVIAVSAAVRSSLEALGPCRNVVVIHNGVDLAAFRPRADGASLRASMGVGQEAPLIGMVGVLARWKGQEVFLEAARRILKLRPDARFAIVGDEIYRTEGHGTFRDRLKQLASEKGLGSAVTFLRHQADVPAVLGAFDVVVHASTEPEAFGLVPLEAMACGRPLVASRVGAVPEVVGEDGAAAWLVPPGDATALAEAISALLLDAGASRRMGAAGRQRAEQLFDVRRVVCEIEQLYTTLARTR